MPTPSEEIVTSPLPSPPPEPHTHRSQYATCPPEDARPFGMPSSPDSLRPESFCPPQQQPTPPAETMDLSQHPAQRLLRESTFNSVETEDDGPLPIAASSPTSTIAESKDRTEQAVSSLPSSNAAKHRSPESSIGYEFSNVRLLPESSSSFLRPGSRFKGTQTSDKQTYNVSVEIKHVDMSESFLCGYLRIQGLTNEHPELTTYFEGEMIGTKYTFQTKRREWGSSEKVDMQHWARFPAWRPLSKQAKKPDFSYKDFDQREHIFMRWKEYFLVPDHSVTSISGASFEGFYYICFNQIKGEVNGIYFHSKSEKWQNLDLQHVPNHGCWGAMEFR